MWQHIGLNSLLIDSMQQGTHGGALLVLLELLRFWIPFSLSSIPKIPKTKTIFGVLDVYIFK
jgi:hypothetical protein